MIERSFLCRIIGLCAVSFAPDVIYSQVLNSVPTRIGGHALNPAAPLEGLNATSFNPNLVEGRVGIFNSVGNTDGFRTTIGVK